MLRLPDHFHRVADPILHGQIVVQLHVEIQLIRYKVVLAWMPVFLDGHVLDSERLERLVAVERVLCGLDDRLVPAFAVELPGHDSLAFALFFQICLLVFDA